MSLTFLRTSANPKSNPEWLGLGVQIKPLAALPHETADFVQPVGPAGDFVAGDKFHGAPSVLGPPASERTTFKPSQDTDSVSKSSWGGRVIGCQVRSK